MAHTPVDLIELTERLLSAAFCRMHLLSRRRTREIPEDLKRDLEVLAQDIGTLSERLLELAGASTFDPAARALLVPLVAALKGIGTQPLASAASTAAYKSARSVVLDLARVIEAPSPHLPTTLAGLLVLHPFSGKAARILTQLPTPDGEDILASYARGESLSSIARRHGVTRQAVHQYLKRRGAIKG